MHNSFGNIFKVHTFGESHGVALGAVIDGCPAGVTFDLELLKAHLAKRRPGQSNISTERNEGDVPEVLSGIFEGKTTGAPIAVVVRNKDAKSKDYSHLKEVYRPGHADYTYEQKYGLRDYRGGGRSSARTTLAWVIGGAIAAMLLKQVTEIELGAYVSAIHTTEMKHLADFRSISSMDNKVRCPDTGLAKKMEEAILNAKNEGDSLGGRVTCIIKNIPAGLGEPQAHKIQAQLGHAMMSINAVKGFEYGLGFASSQLKGSEMNDAISTKSRDALKTKTNRSGGIMGGISNGEPIYFTVAFKPTSTISKSQKTINQDGEKVELSAKGRHDPCVVPRAVAIVEAMSYLVLADAWLMNRNAKV